MLVSKGRKYKREGKNIKEKAKTEKLIVTKKWVGSNYRVKAAQVLKRKAKVRK